MSRRPVAVVTGSAGGFGVAIARELLAAGYVVHAVDRVDQAALDATAAELDDPAQLVRHRVDITDGAAVRALAETVGPADVLINNAGIAVFDTAEEADLDVVARMFDVNVIGTARVTQAFLPSLRARGGTVVQVGSIAKLVVFEESGFYAATKHALEAMTEGLVRETAHTALKVRVLRPGNYATGLQAAAAARTPARGPESPYADQRARWRQRLESVLAFPGQDPEDVGLAVIGALQLPERFAVVHVGDDADWIAAENG